MTSPCYATRRLTVLGDAIAIVAAESKAQALAAAEAVKVEYEILPSVMTTKEALTENSPRVHESSPNLCYQHPQIKGDAESAMNSSATIVEAEFSTQLIHQAALEPEASVAYVEPDEDQDNPKLVVIGRSIYIHYHLMVLQEALGWNNIRYEQAFIGVNLV